ncbi:MAG: hypothetical protein CVU56_13505 [Deltaproteobacteria bacterium HGW-Deltaproteobacteria-14]|nr:MAG: hypothetical protein CVU56_13505 [Deltaproteobacteria bacterium HGW-Deltaproteobacteria-14]
MSPADPAESTLIEALAMRWIEARPFEGQTNLRTSAEPVAVPAALAGTVAATKLREQTLDDARYWLALPKPFGLGLECVLLNGDEIARDRGGERALKPARFALSWVDRMDPASQQTTTREITLAELATERGAWRVVGLWTKAERNEQAKHRAAVAALVARLDGGA